VNSDGKTQRVNTFLTTLLFPINDREVGVEMAWKDDVEGMSFLRENALNERAGGAED
jgi:hypothetical protein